MPFKHSVLAMFLAGLTLLAGCRNESDPNPADSTPPLLDKATGWETIGIIKDFPYRDSPTLPSTVRDIELVGDSIGILFQDAPVYTNFNLKLWVSKLKIGGNRVTTIDRRPVQLLAPIVDPNIGFLSFIPNTFQVFRGYTNSTNLGGNSPLLFGASQSSGGLELPIAEVSRDYFTRQTWPFPLYDRGYHFSQVGVDVLQPEFLHSIKSLYIGTAIDNAVSIRYYETDSLNGYYSGITSAAFPDGKVYGIVSKVDGRLLITDPSQDGPRGRKDPFIVASINSPLLRYEAHTDIRLFAQNVGDAILVIARVHTIRNSKKDAIHVYKWNMGSAELNYLYEIPMAYSYLIPSCTGCFHNQFDFDAQDRFYSISYSYESGSHYQPVRISQAGVEKLGPKLFQSERLYGAKAEADGAVRVFNDYLYATVQSVDTTASKRQMNLVRYKLPN